LVCALDQSPARATTGSLVVVGVTSLVSAVAAYRSGKVLLARGVTFGLVALGGAPAGAKLSAHVSEPVLLAAFAVLMLLVGGLMAVRQVRSRRDRAPTLIANWSRLQPRATSRAHQPQPARPTPRPSRLIRPRGRG
jgi:uncharacterized protein